jgi:aspartyl-tRNA(Asn)/glutamyl-tRNA(Gln) amidotransferase subunit A
VRIRELLDRSGLAIGETPRFPRSHRGQTWFEVLTALQSSEAFRVHEHHLEADRELIDTEVLARLEAGRGVTPRLYAQAEEARLNLRTTVNELLEEFDILALPTVPVVAPLIGDRRLAVAGADVEVRSALLSLTSPWNLTGMPAISVPAGRVESLPVAIQLLAAPGNERAMFAAARQLQASQLRRSQVEED